MTKFKTTDEYINAQSPEAAERLTAIRELLHKVLPNTEESIRYDMPAFTVGKDYLYISAYRNHIGMYPAYGITELNQQMQPYRGKNTKDSLHFQHTEPLPLDLIEKIILAKDKAAT